MSYHSQVAETVTRLDVPPNALVYPEGWQSWTPTDTYLITAVQRQPVDERQFVLGYRADRSAPSGVPGQFVADGLLAVADPGAAQLHVFAAVEPSRPVRLVATYRDGVCAVTADDEIDHAVVTLRTTGGWETQDSRAAEPRSQASLGRWAAERCWAAAPKPAPTVWCSWYQYFTELQQADVVENLRTMDSLALDFDVVQIDDGYQAEIGDWLEPSANFPDLPGLVAEIRRHGRRAGIWLAPWLVGAQSKLAAEHPDWLVRDDRGVAVSAGFNWDQPLGVLDTTHGPARAYLRDVMQHFVEMGVDYFKLDFLYAGAVPGVRADGSQAIPAYRELLASVKRWFPQVYVVGCGAPILPSIGMVDAMRVSPDTAPHAQPSHGDFSAPGQLSAMTTGRARRWQDGVWWTNDPDCLLARPGVESRAEWAAYLAESPGLRGCSDRLLSLDSEGLRYTIQHLRCATIQS